MRWFALFAALGGAAWAQSALPRTPTIAAPSVADTPPSAPAHQAEVSYQMGQLTVIAENSSLDGILRDIAQKTGMKISGSVTNQQVYGTYGPAAPATVLTSLLEGSGNNMILREDTSNNPIELVLAPLEGAPSSPIVSSQQAPRPAPQPYRPPHSYAPPQFNPSQNTAPPGQDYAAPPQPQPIYTQPSVPNQPAYQNQPAEPISSGSGSAPDQSSEPSANVPQSPNGVPTPQQIFQELQQLQQRQKAQPPAPAQ